MEALPVWIWPVFVCLLALAVRLWLGSAAGAVSGQRLPSRSGLTIPWLEWLLAAFSTSRRGRAASTQPDAVQVLARKAIGPQHSIVLVAIWGQQLALSIQPGSPPVVLASRCRESTGNPCEMTAGSTCGLARVRPSSSGQEPPCV